MKLASCSMLFLAPPAAAFMMPRGATKPNRAVTNVAVLDTPPVTEANTQQTRDIYDPLGLYAPSSEERRDGRIQVVSDSYIEVIDELNRQRPINDPLGLYPLSSKERRDYRIQVVQSGEEDQSVPKKTITDPMNLYPSNVMATKDQLQQAMNQRPLHDPFALYGPSSPERQEGRIEFATDAADTTFLQEWSRERPLYDPLTLYTDSSDERRNNRIQVLESDDDLATTVARSKAVVDPLQLYPKNDSAVVRGSSNQADLSQALPFMTRPALLDGTLAGDAGFDPLGLASNKEKLLFLRDAELKHSRIAMLAAAGWPLSELANKYLSSMTHLPTLLGVGDRVPSVLNGGLDKVSPLFWVAVVGTASVIEVIQMIQSTKELPQLAQPQPQSLESLNPVPGDNSVMELNRDKKLQLSEIKHGRIAMLAITAFAMQEFVTKLAVVNLAPFFFHPL